MLYRLLNAKIILGIDAVQALCHFGEPYDSFVETRVLHTLLNIKTRTFNKLS
jgi:hypothetical protein